VSVSTAGHPILENIDLHVPSGSQIAIVGPSGAGKSTLVGMLLGWHHPTGELLVDGEPLVSRIEDLRQVTAWVDPTVQIWNQSLLENVIYGSDYPREIGAVLEA